MKLKLILAFCLLLHLQKVEAQKANRSSQWDIKLGHSFYFIDYYELGMHNISADVLYNLTKTLQVGVNAGYGFYERMYKEIDGAYGYGEKSSALLYGALVNFNALNLIDSKKPLRFSLYGSLRLDGNYKFAKETEIIKAGNEINFGLYAGAAYYFGKHWGVFFEYGYSNTYNMRYGLALKF